MPNFDDSIPIGTIGEWTGNGGILYKFSVLEHMEKIAYTKVEILDTSDTYGTFQVGDTPNWSSYDTLFTHIGVPEL